MPNNIIRQDYGTVGTDVQTQMLIAPVLAEMKADRQFAVGDQFIVDSVLYKITTAISVIGTPLVVGTNCELSDTISQQIKGINDYLKPGTFTITKTNAAANFGGRYANSIVLISPFVLDAGTYSAVIPYSSRYYVTIGYFPSSMVSLLFPNAPTSPGSVVSIGLGIYEEQTTNGIAYKDYTQILLYKGDGSSTALDTWYLFVGSASSTTTSYTLANKRYFIPFPLISVGRDVDL